MGTVRSRGGERVVQSVLVVAGSADSDGRRDEALPATPQRSPLLRRGGSLPSIARPPMMKNTLLALVLPLSIAACSDSHANGPVVGTPAVHASVESAAPPKSEPAPDAALT